MKFFAVPYALIVVAALATARPSSAQHILFEEDFEAGFDRWSTTGLWHEAEESGTCSGPAAPFASPSHAMRFGYHDQCKFDGAGDLTTIEAVHIPSWAETAHLSFWSWEDAECDSCKWDWRFVYVSDDAGVTWTKVGEGTQTEVWYLITIDLAPYLGRDVLVRFHFDSVDATDNFYPGWFVDDVRIEAPDCVEPTNLCVTAPNSFGPGAVIGGRGSTSISANYFKVTSQGAPPGQFGLFYYGSQQVELPFGDGWRCVGAGTTGTFRLNPPVQIDATGFAYHLLDFTQPPLSSGPGKIEPGVSWYFQFWYRDPSFGGAGFNLSDALAAIFCP